MLTVYFRDDYQDFLEWDIQNGEVVGCRPFQESVWKGVKVHNRDIKPGDKLIISPVCGRRAILIHPVERVEEKDDVKTDSGQVALVV